MSLAYLDPGNLESDLQSGAYTSYSLLWVLFLSTVFGGVLQVLSLRLGVVTGKNLAQTCRSEYSPIVSKLLWIMTELAIIGSDVQEVVGSAIAFKILFGWPLYVGCLVTAFDTFTFLGLHYFGMRKLEAFIVVLILTMTVTFSSTWALLHLPHRRFFQGWFVPDIPDYAITQAVGTLGAVIMPHNIYLHSALVQSRKVDRGNRRKVAEANKYNTIDASSSLFVSFLINVAVVTAFAGTFFNLKCAQIPQRALLRPSCWDAKRHVLLSVSRAWPVLRIDRSSRNRVRTPWHPRKQREVLLGDRTSRSWPGVHHDRHVCWPVRDGGLSQPQGQSVGTTPHHSIRRPRARYVCRIRCVARRQGRCRHRRRVAKCAAECAASVCAATSSPLHLLQEADGRIQEWPHYQGRWLGAGTPRHFFELLLYHQLRNRSDQAAPDATWFYALVITIGCMYVFFIGVIVKDDAKEFASWVRSKLCGGPSSAYERAPKDTVASILY